MSETIMRATSEPATVPPRMGQSLDCGRILISIGEVAYEWDVTTDVLAWGPNMAAVLGCEPSAVASGRAFAHCCTAEGSSTRFDAVMQSGAQDDGLGVPFQTQYVLHPRSGPSIWVEDTGRWFAGNDGRPVHAHGVMRVVNDRHAHDERLAYLSKFDRLTGEINRWHLMEVLETAAQNAVRYRASCGFLLVAIDNLARLNEAYGFAVADEVIAAVAKRLGSSLRSADTLGRFSGNKFGIVLHNCTLDELPAAAERLLADVRDVAVPTSAGPLAVTVTAGGVVAPRHAHDAQEVLARAQETLADARAKRPGSFLAYRPSIERAARRQENVRATDEIVAALNEGRIVLAFEPIVETVSRRTLLHESLMRIRRADGSLATAGTIIPVAERLGLVRLLDHRVLELVMAELSAAPQLHLSINVSPASTIESDWWGCLQAHLRARPGAAERLTVEITEMAAIHDVDETRGFVARVKDLGCRIAIDDFGAGNTSFRNLRKLGVDIIKIDGAFVQNIGRSQDDRIFVRTMLELSRSLGLSTVAEWVQTEADAALLREWGCDYLQGALIGMASLDRPWSAIQPPSMPVAGRQ